jgi:hypothetical protein
MNEELIEVQEEPRESGIEVVRELIGSNIQIDPTLTIEGAAADAKAAGDRIRAVESDVDDLTRQLSDETTGLNSKAPVILETVSGAIASFSDGADSMPVRKLVANIEPVQDLHGYDSPWPAGGGKNKVNYSVAFPIVSNGITISQNDDGSISINGTATANVNQILMAEVAIDNGAWTISGVPTNSAGGNLSIWARNTTGGTEYTRTYNGLPGTLNISTGSVYIYCTISSGTTVDNVKVYLQLEAGSTATDWTPYENICPISGWTGAEIEQTGKNLFDGQVVSDDYDITHLLKVGNTYTITADFINSSDTAYYYLFKGNADHTDSIRIAYILAGHNRYTPSFVVEEDKYYWVWGGSGWNNVKNVQLELGSTATAYELYTGNQISVDWQSEAGTVYGGTLTLNPDRTGTLVVDHVVIDAVDVNWALASSNRWTAIGLTKRPNGSAGDGKVASGLIAENYKSSTNNQLVFGLENAVAIAANNSLLVKNGSTTESPTGLIVYPVNSPKTFQLTASEVSGILTTLYGTNNVWANTGDVEVTYPADTKLYIDNKITQAIANALNS